MNGTVRALLVILAAVVAAVAASTPGDFPQWVYVVAAGLAAGLAGIGIVPPQMINTSKSPDSKLATYVHRRRY